MRYRLTMAIHGDPWRRYATRRHLVFSANLVLKHPATINGREATEAGVDVAANRLDHNGLTRFPMFLNHLRRQNLDLRRVATH